MSDNANRIVEVRGALETLWPEEIDEAMRDQAEAVALGHMTSETAAIRILRRLGRELESMPEAVAALERDMDDVASNVDADACNWCNGAGCSLCRHTGLRGHSRCA